MKRFYYISDSLDELETIESELETSGISTEQIHILSNDDRDVAIHHLHSVSSFMKKDVVHSSLIGAIMGLIAAILVLVLAKMSGLPGTYTWVPFIFLAIILLGFCTWEGGLYGIQEPNKEFQRFKSELDRGRHILFVDVVAKQTNRLEAIAQSHPQLQAVGGGRSAPWFVVRGQELLRRWYQWGP